MVISKKTILPFLIIITFIVFTFWKTLSNNSSEIQGTHIIKYYDQDSFFRGVSEARQTSQKKDYRIKGGIVPHHLLPSHIVADFFYHISVQKPETLILIGPNHFEKGEFKALSSLYRWKTPHGILEPNTIIIDALLDDYLIYIDEETVQNDHSITGILPYVAYYSPQVKIVPILLSGTYTQAESEKLAQTLSNIVSDNVLVIAPVDFSHYLTSAVAKQKDEVTLEVMNNFDYKTLYSLNNDYLDSAPSIGVLLMLMEKLKTTNHEILFHTNSGEIQKNMFSPSTSYFSILYY